jgi:hypothetical protein
MLKMFHETFLKDAKNLDKLKLTEQTWAWGFQATYTLAYLSVTIGTIKSSSVDKLKLAGRNLG